MAKIIVLQHTECETAGTLGAALEALGHELAAVHAYAGDAVPSGVDGASGLVAMGGPFAVYDASEGPYLADELRLVSEALRAGLPILGVCLGSQLLAAALGARVHPGARKEIGFLPVELTAEGVADPVLGAVARSHVAFHWHGDTFDLPSGAERLASSSITANQAFRYGDRAYGLQFHPEIDERILIGMIAGFGAELVEEGVDAGALVDEYRSRAERLADVSRSIAGGWARLIGTASERTANV